MDKADRKRSIVRRSRGTVRSTEVTHGRGWGTEWEIRRDGRKGVALQIQDL